MRRRELLLRSALLPVAAALGRAGPAHADDPAIPDNPFDGATVRNLARDLAQQAYKAPDASLPDTLNNLDYQAYRSIRFDPGHALWRGQGLKFTEEFFHRGFLYKQRVDIFEVANGRAVQIRYSPDLFTFDKAKPPSDDIGFAGFRIHYPLNRPDYFDEICAFLGASYFRAVAKDQGYGLSARGLAIKTADPAGEEFPTFRSFWLERPAKGSDAIVVHALLDSPSAAAAFRFTIRPGAQTVFDTEMVLYPRTDLATVGIAPLTSMFLFDANDRTRVDDYREAVHDSTGLLIWNGKGEQIWRPLANPRELQISSFSDNGPGGFGLMQRGRQLSDYQDLEAHYEKRPSLWVEPIGDWGEGIVELVEIPTSREVNDNIVAFWRPHDPLKAKGEYLLSYRLHWCWTVPSNSPLAWVADTRCGLAWDQKNRQFVIDFLGGALKGRRADAPPAIDVGADKGKIENAVVEANPATGGWRLSFQLVQGSEKVVEMHARLMDGDNPLTESWIYPVDNLTAPATSLRALPDEAPLAMPTQSLREAPRPSPRPASSPRAMALRRFVVIGGAVLLTIAGVEEMYRVFAVNGLTALAVFMLALFLALFAWIALSFTSALAGFFSLLAGGGRALGTGPDTPLPRLATRTALVMPAYNEQPSRIMAELQAIDESLREIGAGDAFDLFILSDTTDPNIWIAEEAGFLALRERTAGDARIFYRRRPRNIARKSGNIAEWVRRFGGAYQQFLILDADSLMTGETLVRLVGAMERHPDVGLIQTLPIITGATTLFARMQQFAGRVYGPLIAHGIAWWHGAEGNYWGHNALIRTRAFAECAGLPELRGRKPFGGPIMSHDFVEAALMRRGGWAVHMVPGVRGSYEEVPPTLTDLAVRDRRWCQGNLQHAAVLPTRGLYAISRLHLLTGIGSYITAPLWLLFILTGILIAVQARFVQPDYFPQGKSLFPQWPVIDPVRAMWMFVGTMGLLLVPKLLGCVAILLHRRERRGCGGVLRLFLGLLLETLVAGLMAPVVMLTQSIDVAAILLGRDSGWSAQRREDGGIPARETRRLYRRHTVLGLLLGAIAWLVSLYLALWMLPVVLGLALAIPLALLTGRRWSGGGLLRTPEEVEPPPVVARAAELQREWQSATPPGAAGLLRDPRLLQAHIAMLPAPRRARVDPIDATLALGRAKLDEAETLESALAALSAPELVAALGDAAALRRLSELAGTA